MRTIKPRKAPKILSISLPYFPSLEAPPFLIYEHKYPKADKQVIQLCSFCGTLNSSNPCRFCLEIQRSSGLQIQTLSEEQAKNYSVDGAVTCRTLARMD